jgi:hypothetical protein
VKNREDRKETQRVYIELINRERAD